MKNQFKEFVDDRTLWNSFKLGNEKAFSLIYEQNIKILLAYGQKLNQDIEMVEDAIHDLFVDLWRRRDHLSELDQIRYYLVRALKNQMLRSIQKSSLTHVTDPTEMIMKDVQVSSEFEIINVENSENRSNVLTNSIKKLPKRQQEAVLLRYYSELSLDEISVIMTLPKQVVKNLLSKSNNQLREIMKPMVQLVY